jgi:RNA-directed DNA polymerase
MGTLRSRCEEQVSTKQRQITDIAQKYADAKLSTLAHHIDVGWLYVAYERTRKDGALGIDEVDAESYAVKLGENLRALDRRLKDGSYRAPAVKRVYIPKASGNEKRPIGIPTFEDKILQRAVQMVLEPVYELEFSNSSYGFRPGRSAHQAVEALWKGCMDQRGGWVIDLDISKFFDTLDHGKLREILGRRVNDGVIDRVIGKWLNAGVMDQGNVSYQDKGTPQGGVISPLLSNIYLHEVLDSWFVSEVKPRLKGRAFMVRYADDAVIGCERQDDAERIMRVLPLRFGKFGLTVHLEKTKLVDFRMPSDSEGSDSGGFSFLGFYHFWGKSRKGRWTVRRKTDKKRLNRAVKAITDWCKANRHKPYADQHRMLAAKLRGHYAYYGITMNFRSLEKFFLQVRAIWFRWLNRRSDKPSFYWWQYMRRLKVYPLPYPKIVHAACL